MRVAGSIGLAVIAAFTIAGCKGLGDPSNGDAQCTITITGAAAIAGTYTCDQPAVSVWVTLTNVGAVSVNISGTKAISGLFVFSGKPSTGVTYSTEANSASLQSYGFIVTVGASTWEFSAGQQKTPLGTGSLVFSSVDPITTTTAGTSYTTHGTIDGTLVPSPGTTASGNATIHVAF